MKRAAWVCLSALALIAQTSREVSRAAYRAWREAEPALERDAATAGDALAPRASRAAGEAAKYYAARAAQLKQWADGNAQVLASVDTRGSVLKNPESAADVLRMVNAEATLINTNISNLANDPDRGIQQLRQAMERERTALGALRTAISDRQKADDNLAQAENKLEQDRTGAIEQSRALISAVQDSATVVDKEAPAWGAYYQKLAEGARASASPVSAVPRPAAPGAPGAVPVRTPSITPLPLARYTGGWTFPTVNGMYHGAEPEFIDLVVHEENGRATGTFYGRFRVPAGGGDPVVRFDFSGEFKATRNQTFNLETSDGAKGTVELIPGNAFNLIEVTFQTEIKAGKIQRGDVVLIKK